MPYTKLVVAVDLSEDAKKVLARAMALADASAASLDLIHVIEPVPMSAGYDLTPALPLEWENILQQRAEDFVKKLVNEAGRDNIRSHIRVGSVKGEILTLVNDIDADVLVIGSHGRQGIGLLLGSTATSVIHGTPCDVLAVRVGDST